MTNVQLYLAYIIPTLLVLIGILLNRNDNAALRSELAQSTQSLRSELAQNAQSLRSELAQNNAALRAEMVQLRDSIHRDMVQLHERVATVEAKQA